MPGAGTPPAWNRYAYTLYNPLRYVDPSGNFDEYPPDRRPPTKKELIDALLEKLYGQGNNIVLDDELKRNLDIYQSAINEFGDNYIDFPEIEIVVNDWVDLVLDSIGVFGDTVIIITSIDNLALNFLDDIPGWVIWLITDGVDMISIGKGVYDVFGGEFDNLIYEGTTTGIEDILETYHESNELYKLGKLLPFIGIGFNLYDISQNINLAIIEKEGNHNYDK